MPRRSKGDGSIQTLKRKRNDGTEYVRFRAYLRRDGKALTGPTRKTKKEAQADARKLAYEVEQGRSIAAPTGNVLLEDYMVHYFEHIAPHLRYSTQYAYANLIENYIVPHLGNVTVKNISPAMIAGMTQKIRTGTGHATARRTHELLCRALKQAYIWELIDRNPCERLHVPIEKNRVAVILELNEIKRLLDVSKVEPYFYTMFLLTLTLGLRISEVRALQWTDIKDGKLYVQRTATMSPTGPAFGPTKSTAGTRWLTLPDELLVALDTHAQATLDHHNPHGLIFPPLSEGMFISRNTPNKKLRQFCHEANIRSIRFHDLRHTAASLWVRHGVDLVTAAARFGHGNTQVLQQIYLHVFASELDKKMPSLSELTRDE